MGLLNRFTGLFRRKSLERDLDEELHFHIELKTRDNIAAGMPQEEARYAALRAFGGVEQEKEECRDTWGLRFVNELLQDLRYALRQLRRNPGFTVVAVLTLALGIGANTAIFSLVNGVLLAPLPYAQPDRLVAIWEKNLHFGWHVWISYLNFRDWQRNAPAFQSLAAFYVESHNLTNPGPPEHIEGDGVSSGFFATLGVKLALGREFTPREDRRGGAPVAIITHRLWQNRFDGSLHVLGKLVTLDGIDYSVVGVLPPGFHFPLYGHAVVYTPLGQADSAVLDDRGAHDDMLAIGRLRAGVNVLQAQAEMSATQHHLDRLYPDSDQGLGAAVVPLKNEIVGNVRGTLLLLLGAVGLVLLIACANVANLLLARGAARAREFAVRSAIGASGARIVRQLLTESVLLSLAGAALGLPIAAGGVRAVLAIVPGGLPRSQDIGLNLPVLLFAAAVALMVGILFGLAPALKTFTSDLEAGLKEGGRTSSRGRHQVQSGLVIFQMALTLALLVAGGLLFRTIGKMWDTAPGFDPQHVVTFKVGISPSLTKTAQSTQIAYRHLLERIRRLPGVAAADFTAALPLAGQQGQAPFWIDGHEPAVIQSAPRVLNFFTGPNYLRVMKIPLLQGRFFTARDNAKSPKVVVIDSILAHTYFQGENPIGHTISGGFDAKHVYGPYKIIGVVGHVRNAGLGKPSAYTRAEAYFPLYQISDEWVKAMFPDSTIIVRTRLPAAGVMREIRAAVYGAGRGEPIYAVRTMQEIVRQSMSPQRFPMILLGIFAGLALLLASVGIYGVISYSVTQGTHEMGIRMALGAKKHDVLKMVIGQGLKLALIGVAIGVAGALVLTRFLSSLLYGVKPTDPLTFIAVSLILIAVALLACYIPARRAAKVDPMVALRCE